MFLIPKEERRQFNSASFKDILLLLSGEQDRTMELRRLLVKEPLTEPFIFFRSEIVGLV
jgi:hypothetical protein